MKDKPRYSLVKKFYLLLLLALVFSGFGQMPIFKRYYIADIPGLAWSSNFHTNFIVHYISSILLLGLFGYVIVDYFLLGRKRISLTKAAYLRIVLIGCLTITGILGVINNLGGVTFSQGFTMFVDLSHMGLTMIFLITALVLLILRKKWSNG
ncbi:FeS-binding protein [Thermodesulfobacteriota bacterium]